MQNYRIDNANSKGIAIIPKIAAIFTKSFLSKGLNFPINPPSFDIFLIHVVNSKKDTDLD